MSVRQCSPFAIEIFFKLGTITSSVHSRVATTNSLVRNKRKEKLI